MRFFVYLIGLAALVLPVRSLVAESLQLESNPKTTNDTVSSEHIDQLAKCREGILDDQARSQDRRPWVELLFSYRSNHSETLIVVLLRLSDRPQVQQTLCEVLREYARERPQRLSTGYFEPLMMLLGASQDHLRQAASSALADFPGLLVPIRLGQIATDDLEPKIKRLAAIDALAPNTQRRDVVRQLIHLRTRTYWPDLLLETKASSRF